MGRLSRHRKVKSCDPFFKGQKDVDISSNAPVQASQLDSQPVPRKANDLFKDGQKIKLKGKKGKRGKEKKNRGKLDVQRRPGETRREFYQRLDKQAAEEVNKILVKEKRVSQKRKEFLKTRKASKKRQNAMQEDEHKEFITDKVKFGEVVNEPPSFTARPKHAGDEASRKTKMDSLLLQNKLKDQGHQDEHNKPQTLPKSKKRKHMNAFEKQINDKRRLDAIAAYRKIKKKHMQENAS
ncbi:Hypothetical predicted protein [Paramuricea clavata]|uniref:Uncharacterized protein n=1 Tax=Paramuricea clavata TaxID=317549 RepID=A0A7D9ITM9_PARCT|nr:Hypothetical predicted protein [Paramuricea clavata]